MRTHDVVRLMRERGYTPLPVARGQKACKQTAWQQSSLDRFPLDDFDADGNIGVLLGPPSRHLCDIDLDAEDAVVVGGLILADDTWLPETAMRWGRASRGRPSHYGYLLSEEADGKNVACKWQNEMLVEARLKHCQSLVHGCYIEPGPEGKSVIDPIRWYGRMFDPAVTDLPRLLRTVRVIAAATLISRAWRTSTCRHDMTLPIAGWLARGGWTLAEVRSFISAICTVAGDDEVHDRLRACETTVARVSAGEPVTGIPTLVEHLGEAVVRQVQTWVGAAPICADPIALPQEPGPEQDGDTPAEHRGGRRKTKADELLALALAKYRPINMGYEYGMVERERPTIAYSMADFRVLLPRMYYAAYETTCGMDTVSTVIALCESLASQLDVTPTYLRTAHHDGRIIIDMGYSTGEVIVVGPDGWEVVDNSPVLFRRTPLTRPMPLPRGGGDIDDLRAFIRVSQDDFSLLLGWLVCSFFSDMAAPILLLAGLQGSGKTTAARCLTELIDPTTVPLRSEPQQIEDWSVSAAASWAFVLDNLSVIPAWLSDAMCRTVTGDGMVRRRRYTDSEISVLAFRRRIMMTSIDPGAVRGDLADRLVRVELAPVGPDERASEVRIMAEYTEHLPLLLGSLLDVLARVLRQLPSVSTYGHLPRMADFGRILAALDTSGVASDAMTRYYQSASQMLATVVEGDPLGQLLLDLLRSHGGHWRGSNAELLRALQVQAGPKYDRWVPTTTISLGGKLKRLQPALAEHGIIVTQYRTGTERGVDMYISDSHDMSPSPQDDESDEL